MSAAELGMDDGSLLVIKKEIDEMFGDTSVPLEETRERMLTIREYVEEHIDALNEDIGD